MGKIRATKAALEKAAKAALDSSTAARMERAAEQGFDVERPLYRGSRSDEHYQAQFYTESPDYAAQYANMTPIKTDNAAPNIGKYYAQKPFSLKENPQELPGFLAWYEKQQGRIPSDLINEDSGEVLYWYSDKLADYLGETKGAKPAAVVMDEGNGQLATKVYKDGAVRSVNAQFDPAKKDSPNLLAGLANVAAPIVKTAGTAGALYTVGAAVAPEDAEAGVITRGGKRLIEAWHGSPHKFDKFDISKIGTGEGAQAYGHGLYFADSQDVAKGYKDRLSKDAPMVERKFMESLESTGIDLYAENVDPEQLYSFSKQFVYNKGDIQETLADARRLAKMMDSDGQDASGIKNVIRVIERGQKNGMAIPEVQQGALYRTEIDVDPDTLLDWDKPLSEQSEAVQNALRENWPMSGTFDDWAAEGMTGRNLNELAAVELGRNAATGKPADQALVVERLKEAGIPGIRYQDGVSRGKDGGTYNYVMFDDKPISITERGSADPALLAATAGTTAATIAATIAALDSEDYDPLREIKRRQVSSAAGDFARRRESKRRYWQQHRADLLDAVSRAANFTLEAMDMPLKGYLGLAGVAGGLASGQGLDAALQMGANNATRPPEETTYNLGQAASDATGSPAVGAAVHAGLLMGSPL